MIAALRSFFAAQPRVLEWGVVSLNRPLPNSAHLQAWVDQGLHAGLRYMEQRLQERMNPTLLFPWAKSAVLFSLRQSMPFGSDTGNFKVAAYALGEDYHRVARGILNEAEKQLGVRFAGFCDTWPVFERDLAAEAGLGWRGKNTTLIHRQHGSGFMLAGFFLEQVLESSAVVQQDFCGSCTACLDQCPTDAFLEPHRLDASKCLSYWTIEAKGEIPAAISEKSGAWIFGCDICQEVCPWNHKHKKIPAPDSPMDFPRTAREWLSLLRKGGGFQSRFKNSPLSRAGRRAMMRNILIAMRHGEHEEVQELLDTLMSEEDDSVVLAELHKTRDHFNPAPT